MQLDEAAPQGFPQYARTCPKCAQGPGLRCITVHKGVLKVRNGVHQARISANFKHLKSVDRRQLDMFRAVSNGRRRQRKVVVHPDGTIDVIRGAGQL